MLNVLDSLRDSYTRILDAGDPRVGDWPLMQSPWPTLMLVFCYVYFVKVVGPTWMKDRKPFYLRKLMVVYNFTMVVVNAWLFIQIGRLGWFNNYNWRCQPVDYSDNPEAMQMASIGWWYFATRFVEFADTVFFVLRKKFNQISPLHVIHHGLVPVSVWSGVKFAAGGHNTFFPFLNTFVHVLMYLYYGLAAIGPSTQKFLWWKKYMTFVQMLQFVVAFCHGLQLGFSDCDFPRGFLFMITFHSLLFLVLFCDFYQKAYRRHVKEERDRSLVLRKTKQCLSLQNGRFLAFPLWNRKLKSSYRSLHLALAHPPGAEPTIAAYCTEETKYKSRHPRQKNITNKPMLPEKLGNLESGTLKVTFHDWTMFADPRTNGWPLLGSPFPMLTIIASYVYIVKVLGPMWMKNRKPFQIENVIIMYNVAQVILSGFFFFYGGGLTYLSGNYNWFCQPINYATDPETITLVKLGWWYLLLKIAEFLDTIFFVLRKKFTHITALHVSHHSLVAWGIWIGMKFGAGGHNAFFPFINCFVHMIMYSYYCLAALGPRVKPYLWWKKYITIIQMIQFVLIGVHAVLPLFLDCDFHPGFVYAILGHTILFLVMFLNFYIHAYVKKKEKDHVCKARKIKTCGSGQDSKTFNKYINNGSNHFKNGVTNNGALNNETSSKIGNIHNRKSVKDD
ncbi:uncharacterized protein LOC143248093 [Tachypleus tridentatus]|uniref:uncharacterized protein LOC143248093 n=1 Tax=Tachypleus tridentatus TaxID=6853 RepID=UPI003FD549A5